MNKNCHKESVFLKSVEIVKQISKYQFNGESLSSYLEVEGVSLWDAVCPSLAAYVFPQALCRLQNNAKIKLSCANWKEIIPPYMKPHIKNILSNFTTSRLNGRLVNRDFAYANNSRKKNRIYYLGFEPRQIDCLLPLVESLKSCEIKVISSRRNNFKAAVKALGVNFSFIEDTYVKNVGGGFRKQLSCLKKKLRAIKWYKITSILGKENSKLWSYLKDDFYEYNVYLFPQLLRRAAAAKYILDFERPDIIVGADDCDPSARVFFITGRARSIPTLLIQYGMASKESNNWAFLSTDIAAVFSEYAVDILSGIGVDRSKLVITGQPRFDYLLKKTDDKKLVYKELNIPVNKKLVFFASQVLIDKIVGVEDFFDSKEYSDILECVYGLASKIKDIHVLVKPHPDENMNLHNFYLRKHKAKSITLLDKNSDIQPLIKSCDVFLTRSSTTSLEALIASKQVVIINLRKKDIFLDLIDSGLFLEANTKEDVSLMTKKAMSEQDRQVVYSTLRDKLLDKYIYNSDGNSSGRTVQLINKMIAGSNAI